MVWDDMKQELIVKCQSNENELKKLLTHFERAKDEYGDVKRELTIVLSEMESGSRRRRAMTGLKERLHFDDMEQIFMEMNIDVFFSSFTLG